MKLTAFAAFLSLACASTPSLAADFSISFDWAGVPLCSSGKPNTVSNPMFIVKGVPQGTQYIQFKMTDLDVPGYQHGGGWVKMSTDGTVPANAFKYKSPCPPRGRHKYEWTATAKTKKGFGGKKLGIAKARRSYPE